jgi:hypothetical protein
MGLDWRPATSYRHSARLPCLQHSGREDMLDTEGWRKVVRCQPVEQTRGCSRQ